jgi:hypothetical protein
MTWLFLILTSFTGCLTTGQGNRFVLASTEELHEKIQLLSYRVRALEGKHFALQVNRTSSYSATDGLRESHSKHDSFMHPLLEPELLEIKAPMQRDYKSKSVRSSPSAQEHGYHKLDLLTIDDLPLLSTSHGSSTSSQDDDGDLSSVGGESAPIPLRHLHLPLRNPTPAHGMYSQPYHSAANWNHPRTVEPPYQPTGLDLNIFQPDHMPSQFTSAYSDFSCTMPYPSPPMEAQFLTPVHLPVDVPAPLYAWDGGDTNFDTRSSNYAQHHFLSCT